MFNTKLKEDLSRITEERDLAQKDAETARKQLEESRRESRWNGERAANAEAELGREKEESRTQFAQCAAERREMEALRKLIPPLTEDSPFVKIGPNYYLVTAIHTIVCHETGMVASINGKDVHFTANTNGADLAALVATTLQKRRMQR